MKEEEEEEREKASKQRYRKSCGEFKEMRAGVGGGEGGRSCEEGKNRVEIVSIDLACTLLSWMKFPISNSNWISLFSVDSLKFFFLIDHDDSIQGL